MSVHHGLPNVATVSLIWTVGAVAHTSTLTLAWFPNYRTCLSRLSQRTRNIQSPNGRNYLALCPEIYHHRCVTRYWLHSGKGLIAHSQGDAGVGKSSLLVRLTDQRFLANPDPTVRGFSHAMMG